MRAVRIALFLLLPLAGVAEEIAIVRQEAVFSVSGWVPGEPPAAGWGDVFTLHVGGLDSPPVLGAYSIQSGSLTFQPRFPLAPDLRVQAVLNLPGKARVQKTFEPTAARREPSTRVVQVYPSADTLPANQLKLYLEFSAPMSRGEAWSRLSLLDESGTPVDLPFLEIDQELWDPEHKRLTILFDPGRIKRGVLPRDESGPALEEGRRYTLVVDRGWLDAAGIPLADGYRKEFRVGEEVRSPVVPEQWTVSAPAAGSRDSLVVTFPRPLDYALVQHMLAVSDGNDGVPGEVRIEANETRWLFTPEKPWTAGRYELLVDSALEDLAGNRVHRPFDVDVFDPISKRLTKKTVAVPFRIGDE